MEKVEKLHRGARRKARTREKLLAASQKLIASKGLNSVSIQSITEAADVGLGTFYNHFESKTDVLKTIAEDYLYRYGKELDQLIADLDDPAEVVSVSYRYTLAQALDNKSFPILQQMPVAFVLDKIAQRALADIKVGLKTKRFNVDNLNAFMSFISSMGLGVMDHYARGILSQEDAEHTTVYYLRLLGVDEREANALVAKPMPTAKQQT